MIGQNHTACFYISAAQQQHPRAPLLTSISALAKNKWLKPLGRRTQSDTRAADQVRPTESHSEAMVLETENQRQEQRREPTPATLKSPDHHDESENQVEEKPQRSSSYRILGTFTPHSNDDRDGDAMEDPMAWADLEAFGGTKKTLEKPKPPRKLTPEEVRDQLKELHEIEDKMAEATHEKRSKKGVMDTIAWLKKHQEETTSLPERRRTQRSSSFVRSVLGFFRVGSNNHIDQQGTDAGDNDVEESLAYLTSPWGQSALNAEWTEVGFALLNQTILEDMARVRPVIESDELLSASPQAIIALAKWLHMFDQHIDHVVTLKDYLLEERTVLAGVGYKVTTVFDPYKEALGVALEKTHGDRHELGVAILQTFEQLEVVMSDEMTAVKEVIAQSLTEDQEYEALSSLFHNLGDDEASGVVVAKLLGWMKNHMNDTDTQAFLALFDEEVKDRLAGEWMRHYAAYLQLLDEFSVNFEGSLAFFT